MHRAIHRFEIIIKPFAHNIALSIAFLIQMHRRVHPIPVPLQMPGSLIQSAFGDMRGLYERVMVLPVLDAGIFLHRIDDRRTLGMEYCQPRADLIGEGEQVHLGPQLAVVTFCSFFKPLQICFHIFF